MESRVLRIGSMYSNPELHPLSHIGFEVWFNLFFLFIYLFCSTGV
jgi:hypothetical protein